MKNSWFHILKLSLPILLSIGMLKTRGQDFSAFKKEQLIVGSDTLPYRILYPEQFDPNASYPILFFLHGRGESGKDNTKQLTHGASLFLAPAFRKSYPAIIVFPQCSEDSYWSNVMIETVQQKRFFTFRQGGAPTKAMSLLLKLSDQLIRQPYVDRNRVYAGGLSMGGMGTYELIRRKKNTFAAAFAICGGDHPVNAKKYKNIPLWIFHGGLDDVVTPQFSYGIYRSLKELGKEPQFTVYAKANHNSWDPAFAEPNLLRWLFGHRR